MPETPKFKAPPEGEPDAWAKKKKPNLHPFVYPSCVFAQPHAVSSVSLWFQTGGGFALKPLLA